MVNSGVRHSKKVGNTYWISWDELDHRSHGNLSKFTLSENLNLREYRETQSQKKKARLIR